MEPPQLKFSPSDRSVRLDVGDRQTLVFKSREPKAKGDEGEFVQFQPFDSDDWFFIRLDDFRKRINGERKAYEDDWAVAQEGILSCAVWHKDREVDKGLADGTILTPQGTSKLPLSFTARLKDGEDSYADQRLRWEDVSVIPKAPGNPRLWRMSKSAKAIDIYFVPQTSEMSEDELQKCISRLSNSQKKAGWKINAIALEDLKKKGDTFRCISRNFMGLYTTYISADDIDIIIKDQTSKGKGKLTGWLRDFPEDKTKAEKIYAAMKEEYQKSGKAFTGKITGVGDDTKEEGASGGQMPNVETTTDLKQIDPGKRPDLNTIMGQSAKAIAMEFWEEDTEQASEWLHRSAREFGPLHSGVPDSVDNLVFGTYEANSHMTRVESVLDEVISHLKARYHNASGTLVTKIVNKGSYHLVNEHGQRQEVKIPDWVSDADHSYSWLSPELLYRAIFESNECPNMAKCCQTKFHTFSRYTPLTVEGALDSEVWKMYFGKVNARKRIPDESGAGPSYALPTESSGIFMAASFTPETSTTLLMASSGVVANTYAYAPTPPRAPLMDLTTPSPRLDDSHTPRLTTRPRFRSPIGPTQSPYAERPPSSLRGSHYSTVPFHQAAWFSAHSQAPIHRMGDTVIHNPRFLQESHGPSNTHHSPSPGNQVDHPSSSPPHDGFAIVGEIDLFGKSDLRATLKSWHGPPPPNVQVQDELPIFQQAEIKDLSLTALIPWLSGTLLEKAHLSDVTFTHQNYEYTPTKPVGWSLSASLVIDEQFGSLNTILSKALQIPPDSLRIQVTASLGFNHKWSSLSSLDGIVLTGLIFVKDPVTGAKKPVKICDGVTLTSVGVRLYGITTTVLGTFDDKETSHGFAIFGDLGLEVPASKIPLDFRFEIEEYGKFAQLRGVLKGDIWENALGSGLNLTTLSLFTSFDLSSPLKTLNLSLRAHLDAGCASATLSGSYSVGGNFVISAEIDNFGIDGVVDLYKAHSAKEVIAPKDDEFTIESAMITLSSTGGLSVEVKNIKYGDYSAPNASLHLGSYGVDLKAELQDIDFPEFDFKLVKTVLNASFVWGGHSKTSGVELDAIVQLDGIKGLPEIHASVHLYKGPQDSKLQWTVYGEIQGMERSATLGKLIPDLNGTFLGEIGLEDISFIAASKKSPPLSLMNPQKFPIEEGIQFCAVLDKVRQVEQLLGHSSPGLILSATWSKSSGFTLDVDFPTDGFIHLGHGLTTDPIELQIGLKPIQLTIDAGLKVPVPKSSTPLDFKIGLNVKNEDVNLWGQMKGLWNDPFGISRQVSIGPNLAIEANFTLPDILPDGLAFSGGLQIGNVKGQVAVDVSDDPTQELISGKIEHLGIRDVVEFTSDILDVSLPLPPDFIDFEKLSLYISTGVKVGTTFYPAGFSFEADIKIFGAELKASAEVSQGSLKATASIHDLKVGPFSITGLDKKDATLDLEVGSSTQRVSVDGAIHFLGSEVALLLKLEFLPHPEFSFDFILHLTPLLTFSVDARMKGAADLQDLSKVEFYLHAVMEQHIIDYVVKQVTAAIESARKAADAAIDSAEDKVEKAKADMKKGIDTAEEKLKDEKNKWLAHENQVHAHTNKVIDECTAKMKELESKFDEAKKKWDKDMVSAKAKLKEAQADQAAKMNKARADVTKAQKKWDDDIKSKEKAVDDAKATLNRKFGHAEQDIEKAKSKVDSLDRQISAIRNQIYDCEHAGWKFWKYAEIPALEVGLGAVEVAKGVADGVLDVCEAVVKGADYITVKGAVPLAEDALEAVRKGGDGVLKAAEEVLKGVEKATQAIIDAATKVLDGVKTTGDAVVETAKKVYDDYVKVAHALMKAANDAVDALTKSVEWLGYETAKGGLELAKHATVALDVATGVLKAAKATEDGVLEVTEEFIQALGKLFNITKIELTADLNAFAGDYKFAAEVKGVIVGEPFDLKLDLDMKDHSSFIHGIYKHVVQKAPKKK